MLSRDAGDCVEHVRLSGAVDDVVEKRPELRAGELGRSVGYSLDDLLELEIGRDCPPDGAEPLERPRVTPPVVDVRVDADPADDVPIRVAQRIHASEEPAEHAVVPAQGKLHFEGRAGRKRMPPARDDCRQHLRIVDTLPAPALHLLERGAGVFVPAAIVKVDVAVGTCRPAELRHQIEQRPEVRGSDAIGASPGGVMSPPHCKHDAGCRHRATLSRSAPWALFWRSDPASRRRIGTRDSGRR